MVVRIRSHLTKMSDKQALAANISPEFVRRRGAHLERLHALEDMVRELCPLPVSYDVGRGQPPYFTEFTYSEMLGQLFLNPQSSEVSHRMVAEAFARGRVGAFDAVEAILSRAGDKYTLDGAPAGPLPKRVVFLPGTNCFNEMASKEAITRVAHEFPDAIFKPHPMTAEPTLRQLGMQVGYDRLAGPMESGWAYLMAADEVWATTCTEMGLYATLLGKRLRSVGNVRFEAHGAFAPFYHLIRGKEPGAAAADLRQALNSYGSGFIHPDDPDAEGKVRAAIDLALELRQPFKPLAYEYDPGEYTTMTRGQNALRPSGPEGRRDPQVAHPA